ncbi:MAG TPA: ATP synthase subunit I [Burkholderiales bacterium]|nr:ATP synthase subunit I [Burkholderiales bacterium]
MSIIGLQVAVAISVALVFLGWLGTVAAASALVGGAIAVVPGCFYALRVIRSRNASPDRMLRAHYAGEFGKLVLTFAMFAAAFTWLKSVSVLPLFTAYIATLPVYWVALLMFSKIDNK